MDPLQIQLKLAENNCHKRGIRLTIKRKQVLTILLQANKAISAYELMALFKNKFKQKLAPMSVYRVLNFFESIHLVHKLNTINKYIACAHMDCEQSHQLAQFLVCQQCQHVEEVNTHTFNLENIVQSVEQHNYQLVSPHIELNCICHDCLEKNNLTTA